MLYTCNTKDQVQEQSDNSKGWGVRQGLVYYPSNKEKGYHSQTNPTEVFANLGGKRIVNLVYFVMAIITMISVIGMYLWKKEIKLEETLFYMPEMSPKGRSHSLLIITL